MSKNLICSAGSRQDLQKMINDWYFSKSYVITDAGQVQHTGSGKVLATVAVEQKGRRWRFVRQEAV